MNDLSRFCCLNSDCPDHGVRGGENLSVCGCDRVDSKDYGHFSIATGTQRLLVW
jgi:hypothetical protein